MLILSWGFIKAGKTCRSKLAFVLSITIERFEAAGAMDPRAVKKILNQFLFEEMSDKVSSMGYGVDLYH